MIEIFSAAGMEDMGSMSEICRKRISAKKENKNGKSTGGLGNPGGRRSAKVNR